MQAILWDKKQNKVSVASDPRGHGQAKHSAVSDKKDNFLVISDIHLNQDDSSTMTISPSSGSISNDLDKKTFEKLISDIHKNITDGVVAQPTFIILLGDIVGHLRSSSQHVIDSETAVFNELKKNFPSTPIFYTFGNNDSLEKNYGPLQDSDSSTQYKGPYDVAKFRSGWVDGFLSTGKICEKNTYDFPCIIEENTAYGYYSAYIKAKLRLISLNSVLFSPNRKNTTEQEAMAQIQWLKQQLTAAQTLHESVLITLHIPPGNNVYDHSNFWLPKEQTAFLTIISHYQHNIIGILASHTHAEELKIIKDVSQKNITGVYFTAALSTSHGNEPSIKTFYLSKKNQQWSLANYETFHFSANNTTMNFNKLYDYRDYYCNSQDKTLSQCLDNVTADKIKKYFSAGNQYYEGKMRYPEDIILTIPKE
jgi:UDP-2,3-diacylglucosamine pyrophosphatase LpxH